MGLRNIIKVSVNGVKEKVVQDEAGDEATVQTEVIEE